MLVHRAFLQISQSKFLPRLHCRRWMSLQAVRQNDLSKHLEVTFDNGRTTDFPYVWLRDNAPHPSTTYRSNVGVGRTLLLADLDVDVKPEKVEFNEANSVRLTWPDIGEPVEYTAGWLADRDMWNKEVVERRKESMYFHGPTIWDTEKFEEALRFFDFEKALIDDDYLCECFEFLSKWGLMFLDNVPQSAGQLMRLSRELGFHSPTYYGHTFQVKPAAIPTNLAYSSSAFGVHTDIPFFTSPPDIQMLHCIVAAGNNSGHNNFVDGFYAASILRKEAPELYQTLCDTVIEYYEKGIRDEDFGEFYTVCPTKVFNLNHNGQLQRIMLSMQHRSWFIDGTKYNVKLFYEALKYYNNVLYRTENLLRLRLEGGQIAAFDNLRILHGREAFEVTHDRQRHLEGIYFSWDAVRSALRRIKCGRGEMDSF